MWIQLLERLGSFAIASGLVAFVIRSFFSSFLKKDLEKFKADLKIATSEHQIRFGNLHEKRASVIGEFYSDLVLLQLQFNELISLVDFQRRDDGVLERMTQASRSAYQLQSKYLRNRIYFKNETCQKIDAIFENKADIWLELSKPTQGGGAISSYKEAWKKLTDSAPALQKDLEKDFRTMLGVD